MQPKLSLKLLVEQCLNGNLRNVCNSIVTNKINLDTQNAIKLIIAVCNACHKNMSTPQNLNERDLITLSQCLAKYIRDPTPEQYEGYARSVFFILKFLLVKDSYDCAVELEDVLVPRFMPMVQNERHFKTYQSICRSVYNVIVSNAKAKGDIQKVLKLGYLWVALYKSLNNKAGFIENVHNCLMAYIMLKVTPEQLTNFYQETLTVKELEAPTFYPQNINNLSLIYTHLLKFEEYEVAANCYKIGASYLSRTFKGKEFILLSDIMGVVEWLNPGHNSVSTHTPNQSHSSLKTYYKTHNSTPNLQAVCDFISSVAYTVLQIHKKNNQWNEEMQLRASFDKLLYDVSVIMARTPSNSHCNDCPTNLNEAVRTLNTIAALDRISLAQKNNISRNFKMEILRYLEKSVEYLITMKTNNCEKWSKHWYDSGCLLYNIGVHLYNEKDTEMYILYLQKFIQSSIELEGHRSAIIDNVYLTAAFNLLSETYFESQDYNKCLLVTALSIILNDCPKNEIIWWIKAKAASRENSIEDNLELQELTLVSVCRKYTSELAVYLPNGLHLDTERKIELLIYELRQYHAKWKSKLSMSNTFKELSQIASCQLSAQVFIEVWDGDISIHESVPKLLHDTITRVEGEEFDKKNLLLAHLYFLQHKYQIKDTIMKHCDEMEKTMNATRVSHEVVNGVIPPDPNDECDLVSSYECLKLSRYVKMMKELNKALNLAEGWILNNITHDSDRDRLFKLLSNIGHEYRLHSHMTQSLRAWKLALKVANNDLRKIQATGFVLELSDLNRSSVQDLIAQAEKCVPELESTNPEELIIYFLCKAEAYFYVDFNIAYPSFQRAMKLQQQFKCNGMVCARLYLMHHKFITLPCHYKVEGHHEYSLVKIHQANNIICDYYYEAAATTSYNMRIFFEVYENLAKMYHDLRLPREVRCYAKSAIVIAQQMVLPLRTSAFLYYLAHADITTCRFDDCRVKMKDFADILDFNIKTSAIPQVRQKRKDVDVIIDGFNEMMLDIPETVHLSNSGSPTFPAESFKLPHFLTHYEDCTCFYCTCPEYHQFVLKRTYLNAMLCQYEKKMRNTSDFLFGCMQIYESLRVKNQNLIPTLKDDLLQIFYTTLLELGNFYIRNERYEDAEQTNRRLLDREEFLRSRCIHLYNEALMQNINITELKEMKETKPQILKVEPVETNFKTPLSKQNKVTIRPDFAPPDSIKPVKTLPKSLKFDLTEDTESEPVKKTPSRANLPPFMNVKTPAPSCSKIKIYTSKSTKKSKPVLAEMPALKDFGTPLHIHKDEKTDNNSAARTKLLTKRLRSSSRKASSSSVAAAEENPTASTRRVRQNLLEQLDDADIIESSLEERKSRGNK